MKFLILAFAFASFSSSFAQTSNKRIIGADTRARITARTYRPVHDSIGILLTSLEDGFTQCTGTVIGPRHVITAAHCVVHEGKFVDNVTFIPGMNGNIYATTKPFGSFKGIKFRTLKSYFKNQSVENDFGLITFGENLPVPALTLGVIPKSFLNITIAGYPGDKDSGELWEATGKRNVGLLGGTKNSHSVDTMPGESGASVRTNLWGVQSVVGIHSAGQENLIFSDENLALFFDGSHLQLLQKWMAED